MEAVALPSALPRATYQDLLAVPDHLVAELIDGHLYVMPRPRLGHAEAQMGMGSDLREAFGRRKPRGGPGGWIILAEPELHLGHPEATDLVLVRNLAGWRRERMPEVPDTAAAELAPDWVCEVLSPSTEGHDRIRKLEWYGRAGVGWAWLVNPELRSIEVYRRDTAGWVFHGGAMGVEAVRLEPFEAVEFDVTEWWATFAASRRRRRLTPNVQGTAGVGASTALNRANSRTSASRVRAAPVLAPGIGLKDPSCS